MIESLKLDAKQKNKWGDTMSLMSWTAPGFRHLFMKLLTNNDGGHYAVFTDQVPTAATDGKNILANPDFMFKLGLQERVFVLCHEVIHNMYGDVDLLHRCMTTRTVPMHDGTTMPFNEKVMQHSMDFRINALLADSRIGKLPEGGLLDPEMAGPNDSVLDVYKKRYEQEEQNGTLNDPGTGGFDLVMSPGTSTGQTPQQAQQNPQQWAVEAAVAKTLEQMKAQGNMAGALQRLFKEILEPEIPWQDHIRTVIARKSGSNTYNWRKPDRRFIVRDLYMPGRSGFGAGWVCCWGDTSGSISVNDLERYIGELSGIIEDVKPRRLTVLWCDTTVHGVSELEDAGDLVGLQREGVPGKGGGGTSVIPVLDWIQENGYEAPDMFIGFTDLYVTLPDVAPTYPCIWACTTDQGAAFGEIVRINPKK